MIDCPLGLTVDAHHLSMAEQVTQAGKEVGRPSHVGPRLNNHVPLEFRDDLLHDPRIHWVLQDGFPQPFHDVDVLRAGISSLRVLRTAN